MEDFKQETRFIKKIILWLIAAGFVVSAITWFFSRSTKVIDAGIVHYEQFQEIYNTCTKLNKDLCNMKELPDNDKMFEQFSKAQRINTLRSQINRWSEDYNAKSKMFNRSIWKSSALPYEISPNQFNCY